MSQGIRIREPFSHLSHADSDGNTILHHACLSQIPGAILSLVAAGYSASQVNAEGKKPFDLIEDNEIRNQMIAATVVELNEAVFIPEKKSSRARL
ncbi:hypothetical protein ACKF11_13850 [Methylobacillus sp. Pita2]|uniref:hypothetical protein n=1 Tax=Methylobacillus sp. Pita2 TaxID=3383245 RepID=UPI0038B6243D